MKKSFSTLLLFAENGMAQTQLRNKPDIKPIEGSMKKFLTLILICACTFGYTQMNAQCGTTVNTGVCYSVSNGMQPIAVDICSDIPGQIANITFTAGSIEACCDSIVVYSGAAGSGSAGTKIYNDERGSTSLNGLFVNGVVVGECLHVYIKTDFFNNCSDFGGTPASFDISCTPPPPTGYWINNAAAPAPDYSTCQDVVITDAAASLYDSGGPFGNTATEEHNVVTVCPDNACTVDVTIDHDLGGGGSMYLFNGLSRNNETVANPDYLAVLTGAGTYTFTTTGPCFSYYSALFAEKGYQLDYTTNTSGCASLLTTAGDHCSDAIILTSTGSTSMTSIDATSGPVYSGGVVVEGDCDPDLIGDGCTSVVENTVYATFNSCAAGGIVNVTLTDTGCTPGTESPQMYVYGGTCGNLSYVNCEASTTGGNPVVLSFVADPGAAYFVVIDGFLGNECDFGIEVIGCILEDCVPNSGGISTP